MKLWLAGWLACGVVSLVMAQDPGARPPDGFGPPPGFGGSGRPGGPGPGGPNQQPEMKLLAQFDKDGDKRLNRTERIAAREFVKTQRSSQPRGGPPGGRRDAVASGKPGVKIEPSQVQKYASESLYAPDVIRTVFIYFESDDWEKELEDFHNTDVELPARVVVDGKEFQDVGIHFRGASSYFMLSTGNKRSLNLAFDTFHKDQQILGYRTLNLLNSHEDPTYMRPVLYSDIAREYLPALKANFVNVAINGESWGLYVSLQQFNKDFTKEAFGSSKGSRWKAPGSPRGQASLAYLGDSSEVYKKAYTLKTKEDPKAWDALIRLCKTLNETPVEQREKALQPILDIEGALRFLALENVLINNDGYWIRTSDYDLYLDETGKFHVVPGDTNETFARPGGPGFGGPRGRGPGRDGRPPGDGSSPPPQDGQNQRPPDQRPPAGPQMKGVELDPLFAADDSAKPLISKLLAVPALRVRYLAQVRDIADRKLDWKSLSAKITQYQNLITAHVKADTRNLSSYEAFEKGIAGESEPQAGPGRQEAISLKSFADQRRAYLLAYPEILKLPK